LRPILLTCPKEEVEIMRRAVQASNVRNNNFAEYQAEVCVEYEAKGYVEVDDGFFEYREEKRQFIREQLADLFDGLDFSDICPGGAAEGGR